jgi:hypothetical protein
VGSVDGVMTGAGPQDQPGNHDAHWPLMWGDTNCSRHTLIVVDYIWMLQQTVITD